MPKYMPKDGRTLVTNLAKPDLYRLIEQLKRGDAHAKESCIAFLLAESEGIWHGRARAKISRNLKHTTVQEKDREAIVDTVGKRLEHGKFSEQFGDQLNLAVHLDGEKMLEFARRGLRSEKDYVRRYSRKAIERRERMKRILS